VICVLSKLVVGDTAVSGGARGQGAPCPPGADANKYGAPSTPRTATLVREYVWRCWRAGRTKKGCRLQTAAKKEEGVLKKVVKKLKSTWKNFLAGPRWLISKYAPVAPQQNFHAPSVKTLAPPLYRSKCLRQY
jgi:hypothetical protein